MMELRARCLIVSALARDSWPGVKVEGATIEHPLLVQHESRRSAIGGGGQAAVCAVAFNSNACARRAAMREERCR